MDVYPCMEGIEMNENNAAHKIYWEFLTWLND